MGSSGLQADTNNLWLPFCRSQAAIVRKFHAGLAVLLESRSVESLEGNLDLLTALLDTLSALLESKTKADVNVDYTEQLLLTGLCSIASKIEGPVADNVPVDVTVVMKVLADTKNPQTFQQALLLISQFSRLAPLVVLQNALPIFVSVGAHTSQRDDAFTFQVVEKVRFLFLSAVLRFYLLTFVFVARCRLSPASSPSWSRASTTRLRIDSSSGPVRFSSF